MAKASARNYQEKDFTGECMAWLNPYVFKATKARPVGPSGETHKDPYLHPESMLPVWLGPEWDAIRIKDEPWAGRGFQEDKPYDLRFTARECGNLLGFSHTRKKFAESHAVELKLVKDAFSLPASAVAKHQWKALFKAERQGVNSWGWVVVQWRLFEEPSPRIPSGRETWAIPVHKLDQHYAFCSRGLGIEEARLIGYQVPLVRIPGLEKVPRSSPARYRVKNKRPAWDMSALLRRQSHTA